MIYLKHGVFQTWGAWSIALPQLKFFDITDIMWDKVFGYFYQNNLKLGNYQYSESNQYFLSITIFWAYYQASWQMQINISYYFCVLWVFNLIGHNRNKLWNKNRFHYMACIMAILILHNKQAAFSVSIYLTSKSADQWALSYLRWFTGDVW